METDEAKLGQILRNLVSNALKFTEKGEVRVRISCPPGSDLISFFVEDTGIGIAPEHLDVIFQEFSQIHHSIQGRVKGTGLGLSLSRKLAELLGGTLEVSSRQGVGSTFVLTLPQKDLNTARRRRCPFQPARHGCRDSDRGRRRSITLRLPADVSGNAIPDHRVGCAGSRGTRPL